MARNKLEERIGKLEKQLADLTARVSALETPQDWRRTIGMFTGDEVMKQIDEEGRKIREADRRLARPANKKRKGINKKT